MLEVRQLAFAYQHEPVLRDVSFFVSPGEVVSVVGGNGAGKTTLLRLMATLAQPDDGSITFDGSDVFERPYRYRHQLGYLPENPALYDDMTVKEYLNYRALLKGEPSRRVRRRVGESAELCRVENLLRTPIRRLSNGLKKRVALADAVLLRPRILLLDDFLAGLDTEMRESAGEILSRAATFSAVIVTGHELSDLARWTTRFLVLRGGSVTAEITSAGSDPAVLEERVRAALKGGAQ